MATPRVLILRAPGTNCDQESAFAFRQAGADVQLVHVNRLVEDPNQLRQFQIVCLPGGFSYGDDLAAGRVLAVKMQLHLNEALQQFRDAGKLILGICNGFQVILKSGVLLAPDGQGSQATLAWNDSGKFEDRWVHLQATPGNCVFLQGLDDLELPVAHAEGKFVPRSTEVLDRLREAGQIVLRYASADGGDGPLDYPENPNGSVAAIAGICDPTGRVFGLMPHPERHVDATHHPRWTRRRTQPEHGQGLAIFANAVKYFR